MTTSAQKLAILQTPTEVYVNPPMTYHHTLKLLQVWQWENMSLTSALALCKQTGLTGLLVKALDGSAWMNRFDPHPDALGSTHEAAEQWFRAREQGLYYFIWTNPLQDQWELQADVTAQLARVSDGIFLDVEPYQGFWGNAPVGLANQFAGRIRAQARDAFIALQPDPRPGALVSIRLDEWFLHVDAFSGQHYWSTFQVGAEGELQRAAGLQSSLWKPHLPTLPGNAPLHSFPGDLISGFPGFVIWRMGSTPRATLDMLGQIPVTGLYSEKIPPL